MVLELARLVPSQEARAMHLLRDDADLARFIERLKRIEARTDRLGHVAATGLDIRAA